MSVPFFSLSHPPPVPAAVSTYISFHCRILSFRAHAFRATGRGVGIDNERARWMLSDIEIVYTLPIMVRSYLIQCSNGDKINMEHSDIQ